MSAIKTVSRHTGLKEADLLLWGGLGVLAFVIYKGGVAGAVESIMKTLSSSAVGAGAGAVEGVASSVGTAFGLPTTDHTTTDPYVARYIIDYPTGGYAAASRWAGAPALIRAINLPAGSGHEPPAGSAIAQEFPPFVENMPFDLGGDGGPF